MVTVRGKVQVREGVFVGEPGRGRMLRREPQYGARKSVNAGGSDAR